MNNSIAFKIDTLSTLKAKAKTYNVFDQKTPGLCLMIYPGGTKTYYLYRKVNGKPKRLKIGRYGRISIEQARNKAKHYDSQITLGKDFQAEKAVQKNEMLFCELFELYYQQHALLHTKQPEEAKKVLEFHLTSILYKEKIESISNDTMRVLHSKIGKDRGKIIANRILNMVSAIFNFGIKNKYFKGLNPCLNIKRFRANKRDRFLSEEELMSFFDALELEEPLFQDYFSLLLYTGVRKSNLLAMRWADIDMRLNRWRIPEEDTKNQDANIVHLSDPSIKILIRRKELNKTSHLPSMYVFPGTGKNGHLCDPKKSFNRIRKYMQVSDIRIHDLRRTLGSYMAISGASLPIIGKALNHKSMKSTEIYARLSQAPVLLAVNTAVNIMIGNNIDSLFIENKELCNSNIKVNKAVKFNELIAA